MVFSSGTVNPIDICRFNKSVYAEARQIKMPPDHCLSNGRGLTGALRYLRYNESVAWNPNNDPTRRARTNKRIIAIMGAEKSSGNLSRTSSMAQMMSCVKRKSKMAKNPSLIPVTVSAGQLDIQPLSRVQVSAKVIIVLSTGRYTSETRGQTI